MGLDSFFFELFRKIAPEAFFGRLSHQDKPRWPVYSKLLYPTIDLNSRIRGYSICMSDDGDMSSSGARTWGEVARRLEHDVLCMFAGGARSVVLVWDGAVPHAKGPTQQERQKNWLGGLARKGRRPYRWPILEKLKVAPEDALDESKWHMSDYLASDEFRKKAWFRDDQEILMGFNDIYYFPPAKLKFIEFISTFILERMQLPFGARLLLDSAVVEGRLLERALQVRLAPRGLEDQGRLNALHDDAERFDPRVMRERGAVRLVEALPDAPAHGVYSEADDRLVSFVLYLQRQSLQEDHPDERRRPYWPDGSPRRVDVVVCSEDQDIGLGLTMHFNALRRIVGDDAKLVRIFWRHYGGSLAYRSPHKSTEVVDVGRLALALERRFGYALPKDRSFDAALLLAVVALAHTCDYSQKFKGLGAKQFLRAVVENPGRYSDLVALRSSRDLDEPVEALVRYEAFRRLTLDAFEQAHRKRKRWQKAPARKNKGPTAAERAELEEAGPGGSDIDDLEVDFDERGRKLAPSDKRPKMICVQRADQSPTQAPVPSEDATRAHAARVSWAIDKMLNGPRSAYRAQSEFALDPATKLPLHGFRRERGRSGQDDVVAFADRVAPLDLYGVRQPKAT